MVTAYVLCRVSPGMFSDEICVTIDTTDGAHSLMVPREAVVQVPAQAIAVASTDYGNPRPQDVCENDTMADVT